MSLLRSLLPFLLVCAITAARAEKLIVAANAVPHAEILEITKPLLKAQGVELELEVKVFTDYVQPNVQLVEKRVDANFFQHIPFMEQFNRGKGAKLVALTAVHVEPFAVYSRKIKSLAELAEGATIAIPNDPANSGRALLLLAREGLLTLKDPSNILATAKDIITNPKKLKFRELEAAILPRILGQVDAALINTNYALEAGLSPQRDALAIEGKESPYANYLVARPDNQNDPRIAKLSAALVSPEVKAFIEKKYQGAVVPAF